MRASSCADLDRFCAGFLPATAVLPPRPRDVEEEEAEAMAAAGVRPAGVRVRGFEFEEEEDWAGAEYAEEGAG